MGYRGRDLGVGPTLSNATPSETGVLSPGSSPEASRSDHVHARPISVGLVSNSGGDLGLLPAGTVVDLDLNAGSIWTVSTSVSPPGVTVQTIISPTVVGDPTASGRLLEAATDKRLNFFRVILEVSYGGGGVDGALEASIVNPSGVVIDQDSNPINIDGIAATGLRLSYRFFAVKTADNNIGYKLRIRNGSKGINTYRVASILHESIL